MMVTVMAAPALVGVKLVILGRSKNPVAVAVPPTVVTCTLPEAPPAPTCAVIVVIEFVRIIAGTPPKVTAVAPLRFVPVIVTVAPTAALVGENVAIVGAATKVNGPTELTVPPGVVTLTRPVAPAATLAVIWVNDTTVTPVAGTPPKVTVAGAVKPVPVIVIVMPVPALVGVKLVIVGTGANVNPVADAAVPEPGAITHTRPVAPAPTVAVI